MASSHSTPQRNIDVLIIGAGIGGIYQLHQLREAGFTAVAVDKFDGVGGTWYGNRYPGARFDSESYSYGYFFSDELVKEWSWSELFAGQPEIESYLNHVVDRFDLRRDIMLGAFVESAEFDAGDRRWIVTTSTGEVIGARYVISSVGLLSTPQYPDVPGREDFLGTSHHTALWPLEDVDFTGKRVAVVGSGSSGIQLVAAIADEVGEMVAFQRTPNWCAPLNNGPMDEAANADVQQRGSEIHEQLIGSAGGFVHNFPSFTAADHTPEQREEFWESLWTQPGFAKYMSNYLELGANETLSAEYYGFMERKIRSIVKDQAVADRLIPDHLYGAKRPPFGTHYYESFNRDNVTLVDLRQTPMTRITATGIETTEAAYEFDVIIYATGFDAVTGSFDRIDIRNASGVRLVDAWIEGPSTYLGIQTPGFPNFFIIGGPQSVGGNIPRVLEVQANFVTDLLTEARSKHDATVEVSATAAADWNDHVMSTIEGTVMGKAKIDWSFGHNTAGKKLVYRHYAGGMAPYATRLREVQADDFAGFAIIAPDDEVALAAEPRATGVGANVS